MNTKIQHDEIIDQLNIILENLDNKQHLLELLSKFSKLVQNHFTQEEDSMKFYAYPGYENHKLDHEYTLSEIKSMEMRLKIKFDDEYPIHILKNIIINHINTYDYKFEQFHARF